MGVFINLLAGFEQDLSIGAVLAADKKNEIKTSCKIPDLAIPGRNLPANAVINVQFPFRIPSVFPHKIVKVLLKPGKFEGVHGGLGKQGRLWQNLPRVEKPMPAKKRPVVRSNRMRRARSNDTLSLDLRIPS